MDRWTELALAGRDGDRAALEEFVRSSQATVQQLCRHLGDPETAEDLTQEVYYRALRSLPRFREDGTARSWLLAIARNTCADMTRKRIRGRNRLSPAPPPERAESAENWTEELDLLDGLSQDRREAFVLTQLLGLPYAETAEVLGCPVGTVRSRVARARRDLLDALALETQDPPELRGDGVAGSKSG